jgi:caffeoyl-CoA O-methyltransferase
MSNQPNYDRTLSALEDYVVDRFAKEDDVLQWIQAEAARNEMPAISIRAHEGRLLQLLMRSIVTIKVVEIGTLAGYSGVWMARALPVDGTLYTLEKSSKHAQVAKASFERAGVSNKIVLMEGSASDLLPKLTYQAPFDFVFLDADKASYPIYLEWATENLRAGGILTAHNTFRGGNILNPQNDDDRAMAKFNEALAANPRFESTIISMGDGMAFAIKKS